MRLSQVARAFQKAAVITRDINAVKRHRVAKRIINRQIGRLVGRQLRRLFL